MVTNQIKHEKKAFGEAQMHFSGSSGKHVDSIGLAKGFLADWFLNHYSREFSAFQDDTMLSSVAAMISDQKTKADVERYLRGNPIPGYVWTVTDGFKTENCADKMIHSLASKISSKYNVPIAGAVALSGNALRYLACMTAQFKPHYDELLRKIAKSIRGSEHQAAIVLSADISHCAGLLVSETTTCSTVGH